MMKTSVFAMACAGMALGVSAQNRTYDGTDNNLSQTSWGALHDSFLRIGPVSYADGIGSVDMTRPSPRAVSNAVGVHTSDGNARGLSGLFWQFGQFIDHDFTLTEAGGANLPIAIPAGDPHFDPFNSGTEVMDMSRSLFSDGVTSPRSYQNGITHWIDGSVVYGSDATRAAALRSGAGGRMLTSANDMLPYNTSGQPNDNGPMGGPDADFFLAGDVRANEQVGLTAMHTLFVREHNRTADQLAAANPGWGDEDLYQMSRKIVGAKIQKITYDEWLPAMLGEGALSSYAGYDDSVNPNLSVEFTTAAFRFGHSMLNSELPMIGPMGQDHGSLSLADAFFDPTNFTDPAVVDRSLKGLASIEANEFDTRVVDEVRNMLFGPPGSGGLDLLSLNINRGRDHGVGTYNDIRAALGLAPAASWADITSDPALQAQLASVYADPSEVDAFVGMTAEDQLLGASVGETISLIFVDQFERLRDGDRYWYQNDPSLVPYMDMIEGMTLGDLMEMNLDVGMMQPDVFFVPAPASLSLLTAGGLLLTRRRR